VKPHPVVVVAAEDTTLGDVLPRLGADADLALREGRVFIGARRASGHTDQVAAGDEVAMYAARAAGDRTPRILVRRGGIVAAYKPAHVATVPDHRGSAGTLLDEVAKLVGGPRKEIHVTSRLDVGVSGVVTFALDEASRATLTRAREEGRYRRHYIAVASRVPVPAQGEWSDPIGRDRDPRKRRVDGRDASPAKTAYQVHATAGSAALLALEPETGRTHQIRVHASHAGCALYGDAVYGGPTRIISTTGSVTAVDRIALHAAWVEIVCGGGEPFRADAEIPEDLATIWAACGGDSSAFGAAREPLRLESR
jgi:23S rRNA-/tRNA-specific pseudouridylate synthase